MRMNYTARSILAKYSKQRSFSISLPTILGPGLEKTLQAAVPATALSRSGGSSAAPIMQKKRLSLKPSLMLLI
jgi:hypothetical protein